MEAEPIVEAFFDETDEVAHGLGGVILKEFDDNCTVSGIELDSGKFFGGLRFLFSQCSW